MKPRRAGTTSPSAGPPGPSPARANRAGLLRSVLEFFRPADALLVCVYVGLFLLFLVLSFQNFGDAGSLVIHSSGVEYRYDLGSPQTLEFEGPIGKTQLIIDADRNARFVHSDCRDKICIAAGYLKRGGQWAACLPNRIIARMDKQYHALVDPEIDAGAY